MRGWIVRPVDATNVETKKTSHEDFSFAMMVRSKAPPESWPNPGPIHRLEAKI
jgi:hypothetical protein